MGHPTRACLASIAAAVALGGSAAAPVAPAPSKGSPPKASTTPPKAPAPAVQPVTDPTVYYVIRRTEDAWTVMDPAAVERVAGGPVARAYNVTIRRNLLNGGPPQPGYVRTLNEYDCQAHTVRWLTFTIYNRFGAVVVKQDNADPAFQPLARGSEEETSFRVICERGGGGSVVAAPSLGQLVIGLMQAWDDAAMASALAALPPPTAPAKPGAKPPAKPPATPTPGMPRPK